MVWRLKSNLPLVLALILELATTIGLQAEDAPEPDLLKRSRQLATFRSGDVQWATLLPSGDTALFLRVTDSYDFTFIKRNLRTGIDTPLRALKKLYGSSLGYGHAVSPDGNWLVWKNGQEETWWSTLDGQRHGKRNGGITNKILWMADSRHWVEFVDTQVFQYTRAKISDVKIPGQPQVVNMLPQSPLTHSDFRLPPVQLDNALFTKSGHLLVERTRGGDGYNVDILELDVARQGLPAHQFTVHLPSDVGLAEIAFSPDGEHIGWFLRRGKLLLCVSRLDGSDMHLIGALAITNRNPNNPDDALNAEPTSLRWSSDGKSLTFLYRDTLYGAPASGSAAQAPMPAYMSVSKDGNAFAMERKKAESLVTAIQKADLESVKRLIAGGIQINYPGSEGDTPLMFAAVRGQTEIARTLLAAGANPNLRNRWGDTALIKAIEQNQEATALLLLANGARVNVKGYFSQTALLVETRKGAEPGRRSLDGTPAVVRQPSQILVTALLDHGADVNLTGYEGEAAIINASSAGSLPIVQLLVSRGAKVNARDVHGFSALARAVIRERVDLCTFLLDHGADPNIQEAADKTNGETPLIHAAFLGKIELCKLLIAHGANVNKADPAGYTPLSNAVDKGNIELARFLLDKGANPNVRFIDSYMLISAVLANRKDMVELLLQRGANINARGEYYGSGAPEQKTALGWARKQHLNDMVRLLIKAGAKE